MNQYAKNFLAMLLLAFTMAPALFGQDATTQPNISRTLMMLVPAAIAIVFLIRRKRRKRAKAEEQA